MNIQMLAWYMYALLPLKCSSPPAGEGLGLLDHCALEAIPAGEFTALVSLIPRALFDRDSPTTKTGDADWIAARVKAHHDVVCAASSTGPCLPLGFGAMFSSLDALRSWVSVRAPAVAPALGQVRGMTEWGVGLVADNAAFDAYLDEEDTALREVLTASQAATSGTAFLMVRRIEKMRAAARLTHTRYHGGQVAERLVSLGRVLPESCPGGSPAWTVLAPTTADFPHALRIIADGLSLCGLALRVNGPWPAYNFARQTFLLAASMPEGADA